MNLYVWLFARSFGQPRTHLARFVPDLTVEPIALGGVYVAWGTVPGE